MKSNNFICNFRWFREEKDQLKAIIATQRMKLGPPGLLQIQHAQIVDQGKYICVVNNSVGEERVQISLTVTSEYENLTVGTFFQVKSDYNIANTSWSLLTAN